ncbi:MAG: 16S rRNA (adenine(1518)-N(6)/adenine(1519)-N(6))-dimethyltransferase RsmA [Halothiobacillaceae bacterium]
MSTRVPGGHRPRKRFGQNFLHDASVIDRIVSTIDPRPGQAVVEIGPGLGALTCPLLARLGQMDVIELDRDVIPRLRDHCGSLGHLRIHEFDALKFDLAALSAARGQRLRVVGNLPYNISSPLLFHLFSQVDSLQDMTFMLQKEVVDRLAAEPGSRDYGRLSVMAQVICRIESLFTVPPGAFNPPPKVDSAIVRLIPHPRPLVDPVTHGHLAAVVRAAFGQRRKTLRNTLKAILPADTMAEIGIDPSRRPETVSLDEFILMARRVNTPAAN